jgi:hypothetical protein
MLWMQGWTAHGLAISPHGKAYRLLIEHQREFVLQDITAHLETFPFPNGHQTECTTSIRRDTISEVA